MAMAWPRREVTLILLMFASFIAVTAVFWAHTSHRSYLDVYLAIFTASALARIPGIHGLMTGTDGDHRIDESDTILV
jgi:hypothetical protein